MSNFPNSLSNLVTNKNANDLKTGHATQHNDTSDAVNKIESTIGLLPAGIYATMRARLDALEYTALNTQTGTTYTLIISDTSKIVGMNNAAANTLTVPPNSSVAFPIGTNITIRQVGAGQTTLLAGSGVTLNSRGAALKLAGQWAYASIVKVATDTWDVSGDTTT